MEFVKRTDWVDVRWCCIELRNVTVLLDEFWPILLRKQSDTVSKNSAIVQLQLPLNQWNPQAKNSQCKYQLSEKMERQWTRRSELCEPIKPFFQLYWLLLAICWSRSHSVAFFVGLGRRLCYSKNLLKNLLAIDFRSVAQEKRHFSVIHNSEFTRTGRREEENSKTFVCDKGGIAITCEFCRDLQLTVMFSSLYKKIRLIES